VAGGLTASITSAPAIRERPEMAAARARNFMVCCVLYCSTLAQQRLVVSLRLDRNL
jgi:hypothetical protein